MDIFNKDASTAKLLILYESGYTDHEIAHYFNTSPAEITSWRLSQGFPPNKSRKKKTSTLRRSLDPEQFKKMLVFLYIFDLLGKKCCEANVKPDIASFLAEYRKTNYVVKEADI